MPPFGSHSIESGFSHGGLQKEQMRIDEWIAALISPRCHRTEIVEVGGHLDRAVARIDQSGIDRDAPTVQRAIGSLRIGDVIIHARSLPKLDLDRLRAI